MMAFTNGDWRFFWPQTIREFASIPSAWDSTLNTGLGKSSLGFLWITSYLNLTAFFSKFGVSWYFINFFFWFLLPFVLSFLSGFFLFRYFAKSKSKLAILAGFIYSANTYFLLVILGGQSGVALAYSIAPIVLMKFKQFIDNPRPKNAIVASIYISLQLLFDPRILYITLIAILMFFVFDALILKKNFKKIIIFLPVIIFIPLLLHGYWIFPLIFFKTSPLPSGFDNVNNVKFFSFADFSRSISLLHPNWPENIFGKVYFMRPEFILLPIFAYSSLFFIKKRSKIMNLNIIFFVIIGLLGSFLSKGVNGPFGDMYLSLFNYFPGFKMFRDPSKWYILTAISYSFLIPFTIYSIRKIAYSKINNSGLKFIPNLILVFIIIYLIYLVFPNTYAKLGTLFTQGEIPAEYLQFKDYLSSQNTFSRSLWIPQVQRFAYYSNQHPVVMGEELFKKARPEDQLEKLNDPKTESLLEEFSIKYVVIPSDSKEEIFLKDRKYDERKYLNTVNGLRKISWLKERKKFGKIIVFEVPGSMDRFRLENSDTKLTWGALSPSQYKIEAKNGIIGRLIFSENYDENWIAIADGKKIKSEKYKQLFNSFVINDRSDFVEIYYMPQGFVNIGVIISIVTIFSLTGIIIYLNKKYD
ncbi:MAG: hypothetical protein M1524_01890 [Patescibacteria group bacterium]|nr:hypothetical protein [Patescibacteria group bacterium]